MQKAKSKLPDLGEEKKLWQQGHDFVVGLDEVGRGPLAGPVVAAGVCFTFSSSPQLRGGLPRLAEAFSEGGRWGGVKIKNHHLTAPSGRLSSSEERRGLKNIRDSKKLSVRQREEWYEFLTTHPDIKWGIGLVSEKMIDQINILQATKLAMKRALADLTKKGVAAKYLLLDGTFLLDGLDISQKAVKRGDEKIWSCAAASIIAKVTRDRLMLKYHQKFPAYGFDKHKGYGTRQHIAALKQYGSCAIHRRSFAPCRLD